MSNYFQWFQNLSKLQKRGIFYTLCGVILLLYSLFFRKPFDLTGVILCSGLIGLGIYTILLRPPR